MVDINLTNFITVGLMAILFMAIWESVKKKIGKGKTEAVEA